MSDTNVRAIPRDVDQFAADILDCWASGVCRTERAVTRAVRLGPRRWLASWCVERKPEDMWVGAFWRRHPEPIGGHRAFDLWVCLIPCFPVHVWWYRKEAGTR